MKDSCNSRKVVYFAGAIRGDRVVADMISEMISFIKMFNYRVLTEHVGMPDPIDTLAKQLKVNKEALSAEMIERQDIGWLDQATHVIAEISGASTGTGREIEYARVKGLLGKVPATVLCLYRKDREFYASPMICGMTKERYENVDVFAYNTVSEAKDKILSFLHHN